METDRRGIGEAKQVFTISQNVANRLLRYNGLQGTPLYPPLKHEAWHNAGYGDYVFSLSRLDSAKRIDLLLKALAHTKTPVRALIGGSGPDLERLKTLASSLHLEKRVEFLGRLSEEQVTNLYAGALAVFYAPIDEDYGYATVEAMRSSKAVLTGPDSGGVLEFVRDGANGFICASPQNYALALDRLFLDRTLASNLGIQAYQTSQLVPSWELVAATLTAGLV
jgi:glycosyltransferase involved in cell wall biosynthesis